MDGMNQDKSKNTQKTITKRNLSRRMGMRNRSSPNEGESDGASCRVALSFHGSRGEHGMVTSHERDGKGGGVVMCFWTPFSAYRALSVLCFELYLYKNQA